jgi:hypothetical protein
MYEVVRRSHGTREAEASFAKYSLIHAEGIKIQLNSIVQASSAGNRKTSYWYSWWLVASLPHTKTRYAGPKDAQTSSCGHVEMDEFM